MLEETLDDIVNTLVGDVLFKVTCETQHGGKSPFKKNLLHRKVRFGSPLVINVRDITLEDDGSLDDTIPLEGTTSNQWNNEQETDQMVPGDYQNMECTNYTEREVCDQSTSQKRSSNEHIDELSKRLRLESYNDFVVGLNKRIHEPELSALSLPSDSKKMKLNSSLENLNSLAECTLEVEESDPVLRDCIDFTSYHTWSYALDIHYKDLLKVNQGTVCSDNIAYSNAALFLNLFQDEKKLQTCEKDICNNSSLMTDKCSTDKTSDNDLSPTVITDYCISEKRQINTKTDRNSDGLILAKEIIQCEIRNEKCDQDFHSKESYLKFLSDNKITEDSSLLVNMDYSKEEEIQPPLTHSSEEIQSFLMPLTEEPRSDLFTLPADSSMLDLLTRTPEYHHYNRKLNTSPNVELLSYSKNINEYAFSLKPIAYATEKTEINISKTRPNPDPYLSEGNAIPSNKKTQLDKLHPLNGKPKDTARSYNRPKIDDMISELMASQIVHNNDTLDEFITSSPSKSLFHNFVRPCTPRKLDTRRRITFDEVDDSVVPDLEQFAVTQNDTDEENICLNGALQGKQESHVPQEKVVVESSSKSSSFSWNPSSNASHINDDSVVPFSHQLFIDSNQGIRAPQKIRLGLSKKGKNRSLLHPYKKHN